MNMLQESSCSLQVKIHELLTDKESKTKYFTFSLTTWEHLLFSSLLLRSEVPSGMCAKVRTVAASNNRDHARNLSYNCLLALHI